MANSAFAKFRLEGLDEIRATLRQLPEETQKKVLAVALKRAAAPLVRSAKYYASRSVKTGALRASLGAVIKKGKDGRSYAIVGPLRDYYRAGKRIKKGGDFRGADKPANYAHLVEFGHYSAASSGLSRAQLKGKSRRKGTLVAKSFVPAKPFLRPALMATQGEIGAQMAEGIRDGIAKALDRIVKNPAARG